LPVSFNEPTDSEQLTTKKYVDTFAAGLQVKDAVRAATLVAGTLGSSFQNGSIIDGVTLATGDRILIKNQTNAVQNGIYTVNASGAPTRATDYDDAGEANAGTFTTVTEGGQKNTQWTQLNLGTPAPGTDALNFGRLNISGNVNTIQSPSRGTLTGAVTLNSDDLYYTGSTGSTLKSVLDLKVTTNTTQVITGNKTFQGTTNFTGVTTAVTQASTDNSTRIATTAFVKSVASGSGVLTLKKTLTAAQILNSGEGFSPVSIIPAPGAGKVIDLIQVALRFNYVSSTYTMPGQISLRTVGANKGQIIISPSVLSSNMYSYISHFNTFANTAEITLIENQPVEFVVLSGNPTGGDSTVDLYLMYRIITLA
jgi:hypothetical protein